MYGHRSFNILILGVSHISWKIIEIYNLHAHNENWILKFAGSKTLNQHCLVKLEWGCPNGTKYPPRQPIPNRAILPNRARVYRRTDRQTDGRTDRVIPVYPP